MARGLTGSYGQPTQNDPKRFVSRDALAQSIASQLHYQSGKSAEEVRMMSPDEWGSVDKTGVVTPENVADVMRAYEHYVL